MMATNYSTHGPHRAPLGWTAPSLPQRPLDPESSETNDLLEALDDAMFAAIAGQESALREARELWGRAALALTSELLEESREQYLRFAVDVTRQVETNEIRDPARSLIAIELIELLTKG